MRYIRAQVEYGRGGTGDVFQVTSLEDDRGRDLTHRLKEKPDESLHFLSEDHLRQCLENIFGEPIDLDVSGPVA